MFNQEQWAPGLIRNLRFDDGRVNICIFNVLWKALASLTIICPKKFSQQSVEHFSAIQPPKAQSIWRFRTWWKFIIFTKIFEWMKYMSSNLNYFAPKRQLKPTQYTFKICTLECFQDERIMWFCMRSSH